MLPPFVVILGHHDMLAKEAAEEVQKKQNPHQIQDPIHNINKQTGICFTKCATVLISQYDQWTKAMLWWPLTSVTTDRRSLLY
jgi:hypothetical protein